MIEESPRLVPRDDLPEDELHDNDLEEGFFSQPPPPVTADVDLHDDWHHPAPTMSDGQRIAMIVTASMLGIALVVGLGFAAFGGAFVVEPVELSAAPPPVDVIRAVAQTRVEQALASAREGEVEPKAAPAAALEGATGVEAVPGNAATVGAQSPGEAQSASQAEAEALDPAAAQAETATEADGETVAAPAAETEAAAVSSAETTAPQALAVQAEAVAVQAEAVAVQEDVASRKAKPARKARSRASGGNAEFKRLVGGARRAFDRGDAQGAQRKALEAIAVDPTRGYAYVLLGAARDALGNSAGAKAAYQQCLRQATDGQRAACVALSR